MNGMKQKHWILAGIGVAAAAITAYLLINKKKDRREKPPKGAPQIRVENPGDQSEFPNSASESELG